MWSMNGVKNWHSNLNISSQKLKDAYSLEGKLWPT